MFGFQHFTGQRQAHGEPGDPGALTVYTTDKVSTHEMWADQMTVETADKLHSQKTDVTMTTWHSPPGADNHFFDCAVRWSLPAPP